jgi:hypothetical protein
VGAAVRAHEDGTFTVLRGTVKSYPLISYMDTEDNLIFEMSTERVLRFVSALIDAVYIVEEQSESS